MKTRKTRIIATIGPATRRLPIMRALYAAGADIFRLNLKHGSIAEHHKIIAYARKISDGRGKGPALMIDLPGVHHDAGIMLAKETQPEYLVLSYLVSAAEVEAARQILKKEKIRARLVAKVETEKALQDFMPILGEADAVMLGRGDLGRSIRLEYVPFVQKEIVQSCNKQKKFVIVATEMLLSMTENNMPTRAEVGDVANAVIEGADAVMLSEESAVGKYPKEAVAIMDRILREAEHWKRHGHIRIFSLRKGSFDFGKE